MPINSAFLFLLILICIGLKFLIPKQSELYLTVSLFIFDAKTFLVEFICCVLFNAEVFKILLIILL